MKAADGENTTIKNMETLECLKLLGDNNIGRLAYISGGTPHINPITYYHDAEGVQRTIAKRKGEAPKFIRDFSSRLQERKIPIVYGIHIMDIVGKFREDR